MKKQQYIIFCLFIAGVLDSTAALQQQSFDECATDAAAICRVSIHKNSAFEKPPHAAIYTETGATVLETFKGTFADTVRLEYRGGELNGRGEVYCSRPVFEHGGEYLLFIQIRGDGTLYALKHLHSSDPQYAARLDQLRLMDEPGADASDQTSPTSGGMIAYTVGVLPGTTGYASRFLQCDRGEPIEYIVDMDVLPVGLSSNQAMTALGNALAAWENETSLTFKFAGFESFGMAAADVGTSDGRIRIQMHDNHDYIDDNSNTLGIGGRSYSYNDVSWPNGGYGGKVGTNEFDLTTRGYLVMEHTRATLSDPVSFEEVLCHELGHVLSLGHSSETSGETDTTLAEAIMFYQAHADGRGASLNSWDLGNIDTIYPTNTPPYGYDRIIRAISSPSPQAPLSSGVNQADVTAYDLQGSATASIVSADPGFSLEGSNTIFFTPSGWFSDSSEATGSSYFDICYVRMDDGVNLSPPITVRVIQYLSDQNRDQLPNSWVSAHSITGGPSGDDDSDGFTNLEEWFLDSDPQDPQSNLRIALDGSDLSWNTRSRDLYQVQSTSSLTNAFVNIGNPILASDTNETFAIESADQMFYRVQRLP